MNRYWLKSYPKNVPADIDWNQYTSLVQLMEEAFTKSGQHQNHCLEESLQLQKRLRQLTHQVMAAQEDERQKISHELQDEIAQTLLGIIFKINHFGEAKPCIAKTSQNKTRQMRIQAHF